MKKQTIQFSKLFLIPICFFLIQKVSAEENLTFYADTIEAATESIVEVPIKVKNFNEISAFQFTISWEEEALEFLTTEAYNLTNLNEQSFGDVFLADGLLTVLWSGSSINSFSVEDEEIIFSIKFKVIGNLDTQTPIEFTDSPVSRLVIQVKDLDIITIEAFYQSGMIEINSCSQPKETLIDTSVCYGAFLSEITFLKDTSITQTYTAQNGCDSLIITSFKVGRKPFYGVESIPDTCNAGIGQISIIEEIPLLYKWESGSFEKDQNQLDAGKYMVSITDFDGCTVVDSIIINSEDCPKLESNGQCNGSSFNEVVKGCIPFEAKFTNSSVSESTIQRIVWDLGDGNSSNERDPKHIYNQPGEYEARLIISDRFSTDTSEIKIEVLENPLFEMDYQVNDCNPLDYQLIGTGFSADEIIKWEWSIENTVESGQRINYSFDEFDTDYELKLLVENSQCKTEGSLIINTGEDTRLQLLEPTLTPPQCKESNGAIQIQASGGATPYQYNWNHEENSTDKAINLSEGKYTILIKDDNGCEIIDTIFLESDAPKIMDLVIRNRNCGGNTTLVIPKIEGQNGPYSFQWSNGKTDSVSLGFPDKIVQVSVTDATGCETISESIILPSIEPLGLEKDISSVSCFGSCDGIINLFPSGGTAPYHLLLGGEEVPSVITDLCPNNYLVEIIDENGCRKSTIGNVIEPLPFELNPTIINPNNEKKGQIGLNPFGGTRPYTYEWSNGGTLSLINNLEPGAYSVKVTDINGCFIEDEFLLMTTSLQSIPQLIEWDIFPNPVIESLNLKLRFNKHLQLEVNLFNVTGHSLYRNFFSGKDISQRISTYDLASGIYFLELKTEKGRVVQKIIK